MYGIKLVLGSLYLIITMRILAFNSIQNYFVFCEAQTLNNAGVLQESHVIFCVNRRKVAAKSNVLDTREPVKRAHSV